MVQVLTSDRDSEYLWKYILCQYLYLFKSCYSGDFNLPLINWFGKFIDLTLMYMKTSTFCTTEGQILVFKVK